MIALRFLSVSVLVLCGATLASEDSVRTSVRVLDQGAFIEREVRSISLGNPKASDFLSPPTVRWTYPDGGLAFIPEQVAIGDRGATNMIGQTLNNRRFQLFSTTATNPPSPVWEDTTISAGNTSSSDAAAGADVVVGTFVTGNQSELRKYSSDSGVADWSHVFTPQNDGNGARVTVSDDGSTVAAAYPDTVNGQLQVITFDAATGAIHANVNLPETGVRAIRISDDGSRVYVTSGTQIYILDGASGATLTSTSTHGSFDSHTIAGDGLSFAFGGFSGLWIFTDQGGGVFTQTDQLSLPSETFVARCDLSDDGTRLAFSNWKYTTGLQFTVYQYDVVNKTIVAQPPFTGTGTKQNFPYATRISGDGSRVVYGGWGDAGNTNPEVLVFDWGSGTVTFSVDTPGSVFDADIDALGQFVVSGSKAVHANDFGNGGQVDLGDLGGQDYVLRGEPSLGNLLNLDVYGAPGESYSLALALQETTVTVPQCSGVLRLDFAGPNIFFGGGMLPGSGMATIAVPVPSNPGLVGVQVFSQSFRLDFGASTCVISDAIVTRVLP